MPSAPAGAAEAAADGVLGARRDGGLGAHGRRGPAHHLPGGLEVPPCGELHAERRVPGEPWTAV